MKKIFALATVVLLSFGMAFAQDETEISPELQSLMEEENVKADLSIEEIKLEDKYPEAHPTAKRVVLGMKFMPLSGQCIFSYTCLRANFDKGEAMNTAIAHFQDFTVERGFKHYHYTDRKDEIKNYKNGKITYTTYTSYVSFTK